MNRLSPKQFKALYEDEFIASIRVFLHRRGAMMPVFFASVVDITGDLVVYSYNEGFGRWELFGTETP